MPNGITYFQKIAKFEDDVLLPISCYNSEHLRSLRRFRDI